VIVIVKSGFFCVFFFQKKRETRVVEMGFNNFCCYRFLEKKVKNPEFRLTVTAEN